MNCKAGDMAEIIRSDFFPENKGAIVQVSDVGETRTPWGWLWEVKPAWPLKSIGDSSRKVFFDAAPVFFPDAWLRPIRPPETPVTETRDEELTV